MISATIRGFVEKLKPRHREVIEHRFGLDDGERRTLASLGNKYGITRERVRQIEEEALKTLKNHIEGHSMQLQERIVGPACAHVELLGGVRRDDFLLDELRQIFKDEEAHRWHVTLFFMLLGDPMQYARDGETHPFWYVSDDAERRARAFISGFEKTIAANKEDLLYGKGFERYFFKAVRSHRITEAVGVNYLSISPKFAVNSFGDAGLSEWEEINPRTVRDKAYLILKKHNIPLHFTAITSHINSARLDDRPAHQQTVHNELIKDDRVVLAGRGVYALKEHGFYDGTAREAVSDTLKTHGPLPLKEIVKHVREKKLLRENTILLNIQNKKHFKRLPDGTYYIR